MNYSFLICTFFVTHNENVMLTKWILKKKTTTEQRCMHRVSWEKINKKKDMEVYWTGFLSKYHRFV